MSFGEILESSTRDVGIPIDIDAAVAGAADSIGGGTADIAAPLNTPHVGLLSDLGAMALGTDVLGPEELLELQRGGTRDNGNAVVIAVGTEPG